MSVVNVVCCQVEVSATDLSLVQRSPTDCGHYLRNRSTLDIGVLGYIGIVQHKEHSPEVLSIPPVCVYIYIESLSRKFKFH